MNPRALVALAALAPLLIAGCASGSGTSPDPADEAPEAELAAAWLDGGRMVGVVTWGSSSCVPEATDVDYEAGELAVELADPEGTAPCTADYAPRTTLVGVEGGFDPSADLAITVTGTYAGSTLLTGDPDAAAPSQVSPEAGMTDYLPSAGWFGEDGFALLTWGSSGCPPELESAEATGDTEITVTFVTPPENRACTMDMAPRVLTIPVDTTDLGSDAVEAVLNGDEYRGVRVPILGVR